MHTRRELANAIRALSMDAVEAAHSGHPGAPMGMADVAEVLWHDFLRHNPTNPNWVDRDRFVLSNGHGSMLLYAVLHLTGYELELDALRHFRQLHSPTAGHPEYGECPGVETTTGPLGQGFANAVGMAIATQRLEEEFNRPNHHIVNHNIWVSVGDGCLMEGISHEAASLAGTLKLSRLIAIYDDNGISIDGETKHWFTEDVALRFRSYGWKVIPAVDGHDPESITQAFTEATQEPDRPTLICTKTVIGYGSPNKSGTSSAHGSPLGEDEIDASRHELDWTNKPFEIPQGIKDQWSTVDYGRNLESQWQAEFDAYAKDHPKLAAEYLRRMDGQLPSNWTHELDALGEQESSNGSKVATRKASGNCLDRIGPQLPELIGGSADLAGSNNTLWNGCNWFHDGGRHLNFGVREFGMTAIANGMALHGGFIPYTGTFLVFMDYARNAVRLAAIMGVRQIFVYTHDSVGVGEDGPTHQPVEHLTSVRSIPNVSTWRPCDTVETVAAWRAALERNDGPTALVLSRQSTQPQERSQVALDDVKRGGYVLRKEESTLDALVIATGSEVELAVEAAASLQLQGIDVRVISMPSVDTFKQQSTAYRDSVLPPTARKRVAVEAASTDYWRQFVGLDGKIVGIDRFGVSAPGDQAMEYLGIHTDAVVSAIRDVVAA